MTNAKPRTLADALKKIAVLKREVEATRKRLVRERDAESQRADAAEAERDEALDALDAVRDVLDATPPESVQGPPGYPEARR